MKNKITVNKTAFYHTLGNVKTAKTIWFVLHGYGYLAEFFIKKFEPILNDNTAVIAPEALSKFYSNGVGYDGRLGASWMTKDNRETEIEDYINYLNQLYEVIISGNRTANLKINIVGFSQGGATASRWIANGKAKCDNIIIWSSAFPEDLDLKLLPKKSNTFILFGDDDKFINEKQIIDYEQFLDNSEFDCQLVKFKGKHDIPKEVLLKQSELNDW